MAVIRETGGLNLKDEEQRHAHFGKFCMAQSVLQLVQATMVVQGLGAEPVKVDDSYKKRRSPLRACIHL